MAARFRDLVGQTFARLTVIEHAGMRQFTNGRESQWKCRCICGTELVVPQRYLVAKKNGVRSCGCLIGQHKRTHGGTGTPTFITWSSMLARCNDRGNDNFGRYGGRGIRVCDRWLKFEHFIADMGERPDGMTLDRYPNNDGHYEPGNCRWATGIEQSNNRRSSRLLTVGAETLTLAQWEKRSGFKAGTVHKRLGYGWSPEDAVFRKARPYPARVQR